MFPGVLALVVVALAFVTPAGAITINGIDYVLLANKRIGMESGPTVITGNVGVNDPNGILDIGAGVRIIGLARAHKIDAGQGALIDSCQFDIKVGLGVCTASSSPFVPIVAWPPLGTPVVDPCVDAAADFNVPNGTTLALGPGCYGLVTVGINATLNLSAGNYQVLDLNLGQGATIDGAGPTSTIVTSKKVVTFQANNTISDIRIQTPIVTASEVIQIGNGSQVNNAILYAPFGKLHLHTASFGTGTELIANTMQIQPVQFDLQLQDCACISEVTKINSTTVHVKGLNLSAFTSYVLSADCNVDAGDKAMTKVGAGSSTDQDLTVPGGTTCTNCHVIGVSSGSTSCSTDLVTLP
jgi:hypothetical protein